MAGVPGEVFAVSPPPRPAGWSAALLWAILAAPGCQLLTGDEPGPSEITISPGALTFDAVGDRATLIAEVRDRSGGVLLEATVSWSSSDPTVASVTASGQVTARGNGAATVTAASGNATSGISVTVMQLATALEQVSGNLQTGPAGEPLPSPLVVRASDRLGQPATGVPVAFRVLEGDGSVSAAEVATDANGRASVVWTLGTVAGETQSLRSSLAYRVGVGVRFEAVAAAGPAARIVVLSGDDQTAPRGSALVEPVEVAVEDQFGNPLAGVAVRFLVVGGAGSVRPASVVTGADGRAHAVWILGDPLGSQSLEVRVGALPPAVLSATATPVPERLTILAGDGQNGAVGTPLPEPIFARVLGPGGVPIPSLDVSFSAAAGSGTLRGAADSEAVAELVVRTDADGVAVLGSWILGTSPGLQSLEVRVPGLPAERVSATAAPGPAALLGAVSGDGQEGVREMPLSEPLVVRVTDAFGNAISGTTVTFAPAAGSGSVAPDAATSGDGGIASTEWTLGRTFGEQSVTASIPSGASHTFLARAAAGDGSGGFSIEFHFIDPPSATLRQAFETAAMRWSELIPEKADPRPVSLGPGTCGEGSPRIERTIDDLLVVVRLQEIDGVTGILGQARVCARRSSNQPPLVSRIELDTADIARLEAGGRLDDLLLHEIAHTLGFGSLWAERGLLVNPSLPGSRGADTHFRGEGAIAAFDAIGGASYPGAKVPVENESGGAGTRDSHWRNSVFLNELMTGSLSFRANPLSRVTLASLADLGYGVDLDGADDFGIATAPPAQAPGEQAIPIGDDVLKGPIYIIEPDGRVSDVVVPE